jgi:hypothetical protein
MAEEEGKGESQWILGRQTDKPLVGSFRAVLSTANGERCLNLPLMPCKRRRTELFSWPFFWLPYGCRQRVSGFRLC